MVKNIHLVVLVHGLWGCDKDMEYMNTSLLNCRENNISLAELPELEDTEKDKQYNLIYTSNNNSRFRTYDGIEICGKRLQLEIYEVINRIYQSTDNVQINKFSIVAYSLGGLISRYCLGLLYNDRFFSSEWVGHLSEQPIEFVNFITFVSPHVGVISPYSRVAKLVGHSGVQLYLKDKDKIVYQMSLPNSSFIKGLKKFKHLKLYSNCINDLKTNFFTTGISHVDPFKIFYENDINEVKWVKFIDGYENVIIDYESSHLTIESKDTDEFKHEEKFSVLNEETAKEIDVDVALPTPDKNNKFAQLMVAYYDKFVSILFLILFVVFRTPYEIVLSYIRRQKLVKKYKTDFKLINHIKTDMSIKPDISISSDSSDSEDELTPLMIAATESNNKIIAESFNTDGKSPLSLAKRTFKSLIDIDNKPSYYLRELIDLGYEELFHLKQTFFDIEIVNPSDFELQHRIISNLNKNKLKWERYPCLIKESKFTHAAIIVRYDKPKENFHEGTFVIKHLIDHLNF